MKASELRPGQWFEFEPTGERRLCVYQHDDGRTVFIAVRPHNPTRNLYPVLDSCCHSLDVTPLNVHGWDDEPQSEPSPQVLLDYMAQQFPALLSPVLEQWMKKHKVKPAPLQLREGAWYRDGNEHVYQVASVPVSDGDPYCFKAKGVIRWYTSSGVSCTRTQSDDLIAEVPPPVEPEQFNAGDWVVCVDDGSISRLKVGSLYQLTSVSEHFVSIDDDKRCTLNPLRFRRATPAEVAAYLAKKCPQQYTDLATNDEYDWPKVPAVQDLSSWLHGNGFPGLGFAVTRGCYWVNQLCDASDVLMANLEKEARQFFAEDITASEDAQEPQPDADDWTPPPFDPDDTATVSGCIARPKPDPDDFTAIGCIDFAGRFRAKSKREVITHWVEYVQQASEANRE